MKKMKIGMVLDGFYPKDIRVRKEAESLAKLHDVYVFCVRQNFESEYEEVNNVHVYRKISYKGIVYKGIMDVISSVNFIYPYFKKELLLFVKKHKIQVLHVHDLPLAKTVCVVANRTGVKTILDLHENYPAALKTWFLWRKNPIIKLKNNLFFNYNRWIKYEKNIVKKFDFIIAVVEEMKERIIEQHAVDPNKIIIVTNAEKKEFTNHFLENPNGYFKDSKRFYISYVGGFGPHRGLQTAIEGMKYVKDQIPNSKLVLVGPANKDILSYLNALILKYNVKDYVEIRGAEPFKNVSNIMKSSHINIIPHIYNEHTKSTIPHKFFQSLLSGKPLLVSSCGPMKRITKDKNIGTVFVAEDAKSFATEAIYIYKNYDEALKKAEIGYKEAYSGSLTWEKASENLLDLYQKLV